MTARTQVPARLPFFAIFALLSLGAVLMGCAIAHGNGMSLGSMSRNPAAWALGALLAAVFAMQRSDGFLRGILVAAPVGLAATLMNAGQQGVHRWTDLGPVHANLAAVLLPGAIVALAVLSGRERWTWIVAAVVGVLLVLQPDASQAAAFGAGVIAILLRHRASWAMRGAGIAAALGMIVAAWMRPDPLVPVPEVEGIIGLAAGWSPLVAVVAILMLAVVVLSPLLVARGVDGLPQTAAVALVAYFAATALAPATGNFPVPLVGMGMSPVIGFWLGWGALLAVARRQAAMEG
jgi:cell division protein FtsW (lipid II flippase)